MSKRGLWIRAIIGAVIIATLGVTAGVVAATVTAPPVLSIPAAIAEKTLFPVYTLSKLPPGYSLNQRSFTTKDEALIFSLTKGNDSLVFAEQAKPKDFDLPAFYQKQLHDTKNLQSVANPSVIGTLENGNKLLSVMTDSTWLLITATPATPEDDLRFVAEHLVRR